jgi:hypothetical protein
MMRKILCWNVLCLASWLCMPLRGEDTTLPRTTVPRLQPTIDGKLDAAEWQGASTVVGLWGMKGDLAALQTTFYVGFDDQHLYVAFASPFSGGWPKAAVKARDGDGMWSDDSVEIFLQPAPDKGTYFQLVFNSAGFFYDGRCTGRGQADTANPFDAKVQYKTDIRWLDQMMTSGVWIGEMAIPFADLGVTAPADGTLWRANFCRNNYTGRREDLDGAMYTMWSYTMEGYHRPERFGELLFTRTGPAIHIERLLELREGNIGFTGTLTNPANEPRTYRLKYLALARENQKIVFDEGVDLAVPANTAVPLQLDQQLITPGSGWPVSLEYSITDAQGTAFLRNLHYFTCFPAFRLDLTPLFGQNKLGLKVDVRRLAALPAQFTARIEVLDRDSRPLKAQPLEGLSGKQRVAEATVDIGGVAAGDYQVKVTLLDGEKELATSTGHLTVPATPPWLQERVGMTAKVPPPWVPLKVTGSKVESLTQSYDFANTVPFPAAMRVLGADLLAGPITVEAVVGGQPVAWPATQVQTTAASDGKVALKLQTAAGNLRLAGDMSVEFDGFITLDWRLESAPATTLDALYVHIPLRPEKARYLKTRTARDPFRGESPSEFYDCRLIGDKGWTWSNGWPFDLWLGDDDTGITWVTTSFEHWHSEAPVRVTREEDRVDVRLNLVDKPLALSQALRYTMVLLATPARPRTPGWTRWHLLWNRPDIGAEIGANVITDGGHVAANNSPETYPMPKLGTPAGNGAVGMIGQAHQFGEKYFLTTRTYCPGYETPAFKTYGAEWKAIPDMAFPMQGTIMGNACAFTAFTDYLIWDMRRTVREFKNDGFYCDSSGPLLCANYRHGCGWWNETKKDWEVTYNILGTRDLYKRFYQMLLDEGLPHPIIFHHGLPGIPLAHFVDTVTYGEFMEAWAWKDQLHYPLFADRCALFRVWFAENQFGSVPRWYFSQFVKGKMPEADRDRIGEEALGLAALHNMETEDVSYESLKRFWRIKDAFDIGAAEWILYTQSAPWVRTEREDVVVSLYRKPRQVLLVVGNTSAANYEGKVVLDLPKLGLTWDLTAVERWHGGELAVRDGAIAVQVPAYRFLLVEVSATPPRGPELARNPGFEVVPDPDALPEGWGQYPGTKGTATTVADAGSAHRGSYYIKVDCPKEAGTPVCRVNGVCTPAAGQNGRAHVEIGKQYALSFWARGHAEVTLAVYEYTDQAWLPPTIALDTATVDSEQWQRYESVYTPSPTGKHPARGEQVTRYADFGVTVQGSVCLDDFSFRRVEEPEAKKP